MANLFRRSVKGNRWLFTHLDRTLAAIERIDRATESISDAIESLEKTGHKIAAMRALLDDLKALRLAESMERAIRAADLFELVDERPPPASPPPALPAPRTMGFYPHGYRGGPL